MFATIIAMPEDDFAAMEEEVCTLFVLVNMVVMRAKARAYDAAFERALMYGEDLPLADWKVL